MSAPLDEAVDIALTLAMEVYRRRGFAADALADAITAGLGAAEERLPESVHVPALGYDLPVGVILDVLRPLVDAGIRKAVELAQPQVVTVETEDGVVVTGTVRR